jgi:hypothetical protein
MSSLWSKPITDVSLPSTRIQYLTRGYSDMSWDIQQSRLANEETRTWPELVGEEACGKRLADAWGRRLGRTGGLENLGGRLEEVGRDRKA